MTKQAEFGEMEASYPNYLDWQAQSTSFDSLAGYSSNGGLLWSGAGDPQPVPAATVSSNFFSTLGVTAELGRIFGGEVGNGTNQAQSMVISYACWKNRFGGRSETPGKTVRFGSNTYTIMGILPRWFEFAPVGSA